MNTIDDGGPAFPITYEWINQTDENAIAPDGSVAYPRCVVEITDMGMSMRDYFAAKAMQSEISRVGYHQPGDYMLRAAKNAYAMADAMLKARES